MQDFRLVFCTATLNWSDDAEKKCPGVKLFHLIFSLSWEGAANGERREGSPKAVILFQ